jgi:hypothetical protein
MDQRPYAERYQVELETLQQMGFQDKDANLEALIQTEGNIQRAIEQLMHRRNQPK